MSNNHTSCSISYHAFWGRFFEDEQNNISFFVELFSKVKCPLRMVKDADESDILVNSFYGKQEKRENKLEFLIKRRSCSGPIVFFKRSKANCNLRGELEKGQRQIGEARVREKSWKFKLYQVY